MKYLRIGGQSYPLHDAKIVEDGKTVASFKQDGVFVTEQFRQDFQILVTPEDVDDLNPEPELVYVTGVGQVISHIHPPEKCEGRPCCIHHPSDHPLIDLPTLWRDDRGMMERLCQHGVGHPDPDHIAWVRETHGEEASRVEAVHGCCASYCCRGAYTSSDDR